MLPRPWTNRVLPPGRPVGERAWCRSGEEKGELRRRSKAERKAFKMIKHGLEEAIAYSKGETAGARTHTFTSEQIVALRTRLGLSQRQFPEGFQVPVGTLRCWEQGRRIPRGPAQALLTVIDRADVRTIEKIWMQVPVVEEPRKAR
jgi:putative transcriptional regulator